MSAEAARDALIIELCRELRLSTLEREYSAVARQCCDADVGFEDFLRQLLEVEVLERRRRAVARRIREARFPDPKTLGELDLSVENGLSKQKVLELASCAYLEKGEAVVIVGPIGTGKTHLAIALGIEAAKRRKRVAFTRAADLVRTLVEARDERALVQLHQRYRKVDLLIVDELGFVPFDRHEGELLFNLLADRYERRSILLTSNLAFSEWVQVFQNEKLTGALLDRLTHHSHILTTRGASYRTRTRIAAAKASAPTEN